MLDPTPLNGRGRQVKFTPERIEQIKNLVERGCSRKEIAEIIGCTPASLQVTCSRLGVSLRRHRLNNGVAHSPPLEKPEMIEPSPPRDPKVVQLEPPKPRFTLKLEYNGHCLSVPLDYAAITALMIEAEFRGMRLGELVAEILQAASKRE